MNTLFVYNHLIKVYAFFLVLLSPLYFASCEQKNTTEDIAFTESENIKLSSGGQAVIKAGNQFGIDIFKEIIGDEPAKKNILISPVSISLALAMTFNGARGTTKDAMAIALRMNKISGKQINTTCKELTEALLSVDENVLLRIANSVWHRENFSVEKKFLELTTDCFNAEVKGLNYTSPQAVDIINDRVSDQTNEKIPSVINEINPDHVMFLINAIYFRGIWKKEFNAERTYNGHFQTGINSSEEVSMMTLRETIGYTENDLFQAAELDYGRGNFSMVVLLPRQNVSLEVLTEKMNSETFTHWIDSINSCEVHLSLPKFTFAYEKKLNDALKTMGMGVAFQRKADFTGINRKGGLYLDYVKHKTFIEVNEEGTEAAAATVAGIALTSVDPDQGYKTMTVNRPFIFAIREKTTNTMVFLGRVVLPE